MTPQRIQLKRTKGWRMPPNTVLVSRPSRWGNPYRVGAYSSFLDSVMTAEDAKNMFALDMARTALLRGDDFTKALEPLRGKNLACWCKPGDHCHADVLLELANR